MEYWQLKQMQELPLEAKILKTQQRIREWYEYWEGQVCVSFSGGKDSTVLLNLVRQLYPDVTAVFSNTGLEYPEIVQFVQSIDNVVILRPEMNFKKVIENYGYPIISKNTSRFLRDLQNPTDNNENTRQLRLTGIRSDGTKGAIKLAKKWHYLIDSPFKWSEQCCDVMKKKPLKKYIKESNYKPFIGTMTDESRQREIRYLQNGCNAYNLKEPASTPMSFWTEQDVLGYLKKCNAPYCSVYGDIIEENEILKTTGEHRTGCMFCLFGIIPESKNGENRFQRMKRTHPTQYKYCMEKLGLKEVIDYINSGLPEKQRISYV